MNKEEGVVTRTKQKWIDDCRLVEVAPLHQFVENEFYPSQPNRSTMDETSNVTEKRSPLKITI